MEDMIGSISILIWLITKIMWKIRILQCGKFTYQSVLFIWCHECFNREDIGPITNDRDTPRSEQDIFLELRIVEDLYVGMTFESIEDAEELYYTYA
ncbi:hypothetical protein ZOSMA_26G01560 [Zostera marina]|uniref:Uncharacterized protein n=1 Tax=Zostera marina TaxID=29655 RepID=A0A0K9PGP1_ZOSMR|nr:hypothetical protein ZOSMA_26G01560 [Zostera marina]